MNNEENIKDNIPVDEKVDETVREGETPQEEPAQDAEQETAAVKENAADEALEAKYMRLMADFQNFRKRQEKEKADIYAFANEKLVKDMLGVIDNFERALEAAEGVEGQETFREGMSLIFKQLLEVLKKAGLEEIEALGADFDPNFHHAVTMEAGTEYESGKVTTVLQKGYTLNSRVVRPTMVKVAE